MKFKEKMPKSLWVFAKKFSFLYGVLVSYLSSLTKNRL